MEFSNLKDLLSTKEWLVEETSFDISKINIYETLYTIGNGYLGTRGSFEEGHKAGLSGTYINGIFDHYQSFIVELANCPNWTEIAIWVEGRKLSFHNCKVLDHYRALDMRNGFLFREARFQDVEGRITKFQSIRYAHASNMHHYEVQANVTPENYSGNIVIESTVDGNVFNLDLEPSYKEKPQFDPEIKWGQWAKSKHLGHQDACKLEQEGVYLEMKTLDRPHHLGYASAIKIPNADSKVTNQFDYKKVNQLASLQGVQGETIRIQKTVSIYTSRDIEKEDLKSTCQNELMENLKVSFKERFSYHQEAWKQKWEDCDVVIKGDNKANHALRFNIYHLLITANPNDDKANIGAKSLSGEGYSGHIFWDTEIFMLPFYIFTQPETAKALMMYRYHTMKGAREYAREGGNKGVRFPWESADTGHETTPAWTADGTVRIWTGEREIHITSAIVFGLISYLTSTQDTEFLLDYGAEILFETARYWDSRLEYDKAEDRYKLTEVEGPDEYHELVNNSVYTNLMTKWNLEKSAEYYYILKEKHPGKLKEVAGKLSLQEKEVKEWKAKAEKIYIPFDPKNKLIEEFEGYFQLKEVPITEWDENDMPLYPEGYHHDNCSETTLIKQPDVVMLLYILPDLFTDEIKERNYKLDVTWLKDESLEDAGELPDPQDLADDAITELEAVVDDLREIVALVEKEEAVEK